MWVSASPAQAETVDECQAEIAQARALLTDTTNPNYIDSFMNEKDLTGLIGKLDSASTKLSQGKTQDALTNLTSVRDIKVPTLVAQGKLDQADADILLLEINEAIACV
jgi:soluble cytochrome b562